MKNQELSIAMSAYKAERKTNPVRHQEDRLFMVQKLAHSKVPNWGGIKVTSAR